MFHNTTHEIGKTLEVYKASASKQEKRILAYVKEHPSITFTSEDLMFMFPATPITSIRRAVCNLKDAGKIVIIGKTYGMYDRPIFEYTYKGEN